MTEAKEVKPDLPEGWTWTKIEEIAKLNFRDPGISSLPDDFIVTFLPMAAVDAEKGIIAKPEKRSLAQVRKGFTSFSEKDVLFAKITKAGNIPLPPIDCSGYYQACQSIFANIDNMILFFSVRGLETWDQPTRKILMKTAIEDFYKNIKRIELEKDKIN